MKRFLWASPVLFLTLSLSAFADSTRGGITIGLGPNDGSGDNFVFLQGNDIFIDGGTPFAFFNTQGYAPGSTLGGGTQVSFDNGTIKIGSITYNLLFTGPGTLFISPFTVPSNGPAITFVSFSAQALVYVNGQPILLNLGGSASGPFSANSGFFTTTPEPGTLGLMGTGLIGMLGAIRRKLRIKAAAGA